jgi:hypothetical protein
VGSYQPEKASPAEGIREQQREEGKKIKERRQHVTAASGAVRAPQCEDALQKMVEREREIPTQVL